MEKLALSSDLAALKESASRCMADCPAGDAAAMARHLAETGLFAVLVPEAAGGLGLGVTAAMLVAEAAGAALLPYPISESMIAAAAIAGFNPGLSEAVMAGETLVSVAWRGIIDMHHAGGNWLGSGDLSRIPSGEQVQFIMVPARTGANDVVRLALVDARATGIAVEPDSGLDLERPFARLHLSSHGFDGAEFNPAGADWAGIERLGSLLRAAEMFGAAQASYARATEHVTTRKQFGKPLVANQAIRHMLARDHMGLSGVQRSLAFAAAQMDEGAVGGDQARLIACATAAEICPAVVERAIQLHGGMGFTWDLPLHRHLRRIRSATGILNAHAAREELAARILAAND